VSSLEEAVSLEEEASAKRTGEPMAERTTASRNKLRLRNGFRFMLLKLGSLNDFQVTLVLQISKQATRNIAAG
jgi:hypothetical protein